MNLVEFFRRPGAPQPLHFAVAVGHTTDAGVRQWVKDENRRPAHEFVLPVWEASGWRVAPWDCWPTLWYRIWPMFIGMPGAPAVPADFKPPRLPTREELQAIQPELEAAAREAAARELAGTTPTP